MFFLKMAGFSKNRDCPSSEDLLSYERGLKSDHSPKKIKEHLLECDFCSAEVEFYSHYKCCEENVPMEEIPPTLYELAESLLNNKTKGSLLLNKFLLENEGLG